MHTSVCKLSGKEIPVISLDAAIIGSGCAGFNAADWLYDLGRRDTAVITEGVNMGTSRNTGSDKQTYYKLSLASDGEDSIVRLAEDLFGGTGVNGDTAYAEAACSVRSFMKLANLGVQFPTNEYGEYVGYKTDHDPRQRATSAGPLTSRYMTEALERSARAKKIPILDNMLAVELIIDNNAVKGLVCIDKNALDNGCYGLTLISAEHVILATGGPAAIYQNRVYPESQAGMSGMALLAGVRASNLQEWQYGLASIKFRWNVSGTYQQALPRYISVDKNSVTSEFLPGYFDNPHKALDMVFLKGYQWPFDTRKAAGSSIIDLIIHHETFNLNRRVYMDFLKNPAGLEDGFNGLSAETRNYLRNSGALLKTPIARLLRMNAPAVSLYKKNGIDLHCEPLEVSVCAQHHNGGLAVDVNWQTNIGGLYAAGECAGTFGVYRPGGSALNSTQTGSMRAAEHIAYNSKPGRRFEEPEGFIKTAAETWIKNLGGIMRNTGGYRKIADFSNEMSSYASYIRDTGKMKNLMGLIQKELSGFFENASVNNIRELPVIIHARDTMVTQLAVLSAMVKSAEADGTHGSSLILSGNGAPVHNTLPMFSIAPGKPLTDNHLMITHIARNNGEISFESFCEPVRPIPKPESWFENVWKSYLERTAKTHLGGYNGD